MKEINLPSGNYMFVECDQDSHSHSLTKFKTHAVINYKKDFTGNSMWSENIGETNVILLNYEIVATTKDITEKQAESIIEFDEINGEHPDFVNGVAWLNYLNNQYEYNIPFTAKESLQSLIQANELDVNKNYLILKLWKN